MNDWDQTRGVNRTSEDLKIIEGHFVLASLLVNRVKPGGRFVKRDHQIGAAGLVDGS